MTTVTTRYPTIRFPRLVGVEPDTRVRVCWDGARAANGDGVEDGAAVDYDTPIADGLPLWPAGQASVFGGGAWQYGAWDCSANSAPDTGAWMSGAWRGGAWRGGGWWEWTFPFALRDGEYMVGIVLLDGLGNASSGEEIEFEVAALPRAASGLQIVSYVAGTNTLNVAWTASPDLE